jgi:hypothetical protein
MNEPLMNTQAQAQSYLDKAETYKKLGLKAQVRYELEQAKRVDPYVAQEPRFRTLLEDNPQAAKDIQALKIPLRIGTGMLIVNAILSTLFLILIFASGGPSNVNAEDIVSPIANVIIAVNLWQLKEQWKRYTVWWAVLGLVLFGLGALAMGDYFGLIIQAAFSGSLILLLAGTPSKARTATAVGVFLVFYLGVICLVFTLSFLGAFAGTG